MDRSYEDDHEAFAGSRVDQYVYVPTKEKKKKDPHGDGDNDSKSAVAAANAAAGDEGNTIYSVLDQHADTLDGDVKPPLVIYGDTGSGKTALFANWLARRREHNHREEFLFQHYVGCSKDSFQLSQMLIRLETKLKEKFQLREMIVPETEHDLRWSLGRFLLAASKKGSPARIVIIIDGVHQLECEGAAVGSLHWLPIELPPCVRFMVSTVEQDKPTTGLTTTTQASTVGSSYLMDPRDNQQKYKLNSTFVELSRRGYPMLSMEPLGVRARHDIITEFLHMNPTALELAENQQYKIASAPATAQPLFLRSLLQSLKLASCMANLSVDELMDIYLPCQSAYELIDKNFEICFDSSDEESRDYLGKVSSVVYFSRNGLTETEIWGLVRMLTKSVPEDRVKVKIHTFLKAYTMIVQDMHSFSHAIYKDVVFARYIQSKGESTRWHYAMARYFSQLPPCDRKLQALPYHLEEAGSWSRVKNCLTDIEMFQLWWTPKFKKDFLKIWSQLTTRQDYKKQPGANGAAAPAEVDEVKKKRPTYDVVEEYVKSLDEYRTTHTTMKDEMVSDIILQIADFLIEFATLGLEEFADVPASIHPFIPSEDVKSIGVPFVQIGEDGASSTLLYPEILTFNTAKDPDDEQKMSNEVPMATEENLKKPLTTYFFHRWMWIQFPYIALGNCGTRYAEGVAKLQASMADNRDRPLDDNSIVKKPMTAAETRSQMSKSFTQSAAQKLPMLAFNRKAAKSIPRVTAKVDSDENPPDKVGLRLFKLQEDINNYREEYDFIVNMKGALSKRVAELKGTIEELKNVAESCNDVDSALTNMINREADSSKKFGNASDKNRNLKKLWLLCERHPANVPALIQEVETKLDQDKFLVKEIRNRLWEQKFERQTHNSCFKQMRKLAKDGAQMHTELLDYRLEMKRSLMEQQAEDQRRNNESRGAKTAGASGVRNGSGHFVLGNKSKTDASDDPTLVVGDSEEARAARWENTWATITSRTGITEPEIFFQRYNNSKNLQMQIEILKKTSETSLERYNKEMLVVEEEVEEVRLGSSSVDVSSTKAKDSEVSEKTQRLRRSKERTETAEQLLQRVYGGFNHILEALGVPPREAGAPVPDMLHDINNVLDSLLEEREKQHQMGQQNNASAALDGETASQSRMLQARDSNLVSACLCFFNTHSVACAYLLLFACLYFSPPMVPTARLSWRRPSTSSRAINSALPASAPRVPIAMLICRTLPSSVLALSSTRDLIRMTRMLMASMKRVCGTANTSRHSRSAQCA